MVSNTKKVKSANYGPGPVYGLGLIGAAVYYLHVTSGFGAGVVGLLKAIVWPAFLVYHLLGL